MSDKSQIIDFRKVREEKLDEKRRQTERIFFKQLLGIYAVSSNDGLNSIEFLDISEDGCSFRVPFDANNPWPKDHDHVPLRIYFSQDTYLPIHVKIMNASPQIEDGIKYMRYGCKIDRETQSYEAYKRFAQFLSAYSQQAHRDDGKVSFFYL